MVWPIYCFDCLTCIFTSQLVFLVISGTRLLSNVLNILLKDTSHPKTHPSTDMWVEAYGLNTERDTNEEINE